MARTISVAIVCASIPLLMIVWGVILFVKDKRRSGEHKVTVGSSKGKKIFGTFFFAVMYTLLVLSGTLPERTDIMIIEMILSGIFAIPLGLAVLHEFFDYTDVGEAGLTSILLGKSIFTPYDKIAFYYLNHNPNSGHFVGNNIIYYCYDKYGRHICAVESSLKQLPRFTNKMNELNIPLQPFPDELEQTPQFKLYQKIENRKGYIFVIALFEALLIILVGLIMGTAL